MATGAMVLGIIGGLFAFAIGRLGFALGQAADQVGLKVVSVTIPVVGLVGAAVVKSNAKIGGSLMVLSADLCSSAEFSG
jgi:hypothetical protein